MRLLVAALMRRRSRENKRHFLALLYTKPEIIIKPVLTAKAHQNYNIYIMQRVRRLITLYIITYAAKTP
jgi:hypothetical protein